MYSLNSKGQIGTWRTAHSDIEVVFHVQLLQTAQRLQAGNILHLIVTQV